MESVVSGAVKTMPGIRRADANVGGGKGGGACGGCVARPCNEGGGLVSVIAPFWI